MPESQLASRRTRIEETSQCHEGSAAVPEKSGGRKLRSFFMRDEESQDALFIQFGKFKAGAFGLPAIVALLILTIAAAAVLLWR